VQRQLPVEELLAIAREVEALNYGTLWISGGTGPGVFDVVEAALNATKRIKVAIGVVNIWAETPNTVTAAWHRMEERYPGRLFIGLGISHAPLVEGPLKVTYSRPLARTIEFLDELDAQQDPLPPGRRLLGALGPKMLQLAAERSLGTHPYFVTPTNTALARQGVGDAIVAPELGVVLDEDLVAAREVGRSFIKYYLPLPNYTNNWLRSGFNQDDFRNGGSDRLIDSSFALGDLGAIATRVQEHRDAGADHVALQVLSAGNQATTYRQLAGV
jgi:probable F420-dependent oxidoreductase